MRILAASLVALPLISYAQGDAFPAGTVANEHNINGADYPRIGKDGRAPGCMPPMPRRWR